MIAVSEPTRRFAETSIAVGLPTLPVYLFELNSLLDSSPVDLKRVTHLVRTDPSLTAQILKVCHSLPYASPVSRIEEAVVVVGVDRLRALALTCSLASSARREMEFFWQHSLFTAVLSQKVAEWTAYPDPEKAYLAGLIHDLGALAWLAGAGRKDQARDNGVMIAMAWNFPVDLAEVMEWHEEPDQARIDPELTGIVSFAEQYAERCGMGVAQSEPRFHRPTLQEAAELALDCLPEVEDAEARRLALMVELELPNMLLALAVSR